MPLVDPNALETTIRDAISDVIAPLQQKLVFLTERVDETRQLIMPVDNRLNAINDQLQNVHLDQASDEIRRASLRFNPL
uniref:Uncharacterized protein n=1 Tax=Romanomermis culicivorax TaxID=13658 RepID=A0A915JR76_ROMCU